MGNSKEFLKSLPILFSKDLGTYLDFILLEKGLSENTFSSYLHDLKVYAEYLITIDRKSFRESTSDDISQFLSYLANMGIGVSSRTRYLSSIRNLHQFLFATSKSTSNPADIVDMPKPGRSLPETLNFNQVEQILVQPDTTKYAGIRDKAMMETMYACGLRVSELITLKQRDIIKEIEIIRVFGKGNKERIVPIGSIALEWIDKYKSIREMFVKGHTTNDILFLNQRGKPLTRMGFWKILDKYARMSGLDIHVHPHKIGRAHV